MSAARCTVIVVATIVLTANLSAFAQPAAEADSDLNARVLKMLAKKSEPAPAQPASAGGVPAPAPAPTPPSAKPATPPDLPAATTLTPPTPRPRLDLPDPSAPAQPSPTETQKSSGTLFPQTWDNGPSHMPVPAAKTEKSDKPRAADSGTYTIASGDTFVTIAKAKLGDANKWAVIAKSNPTVDPTRLKIGQVIKLPAAADVAAATEHTAKKADATAHVDHTVDPAPLINVTLNPRSPTDHAKKADAPGTVTVAAGDNLHTIARRVYGKPGEWHAIFEANRDKLQDPDDLQVGMVLKVPAPKTTKSN